MPKPNVFCSPLKLNGHPVWYARDEHGRITATRFPTDRESETDAIIELALLVAFEAIQRATKPDLRLVTLDDDASSLDGPFRRAARPARPA